MDETKQYIEQAFGRLSEDKFMRSRVLLLLCVGAEQAVKAAAPEDLVTEDFPNGMTTDDVVREAVGDIVQLGARVTDVDAWIAAATEVRKALDGARLFADDAPGREAPR